MKTLLTILMIGSLMVPVSMNAANKHNTPAQHKDTMSMRCILYTPELFYGIELGEKNAKDMVDTLVGEVPFYDTNDNYNLVILSARDLGFENERDIFWQDILDSAESKGYGVCPAQVAPELFVQSQNMSNSSLLAKRASGSRPLFVGMDKIKHAAVTAKKNRQAKDAFDYVFCIKRDTRKHAYALGYCATNKANNRAEFTWNSNDLFIFIDKPNKRKNKATYCKN